MGGEGTNFVNLRGITARAAAVVNPAKLATLYVNSGYTTNADGDRVPTYVTKRRVPIDVQELSERDILHVDALNVGGATHTVYLTGELNGLVRPENKGGDLIDFAEADGTPRRYLVKAVLEHWPDWTKVAVTMQMDL